MSVERIHKRLWEIRMFPQKIEQPALLGLGHKLCSFFTHVLCRNSNSYSTKQIVLLLLRKYIWNPKLIDSTIMCTQSTYVHRILHIELALVAYCSISSRLENIVTSSKYIINQRSRNECVTWYYCILMTSH